MSGGRARNGFTQNGEAVARGLRELEQVQDPILREAVAAALRLRARELRLDPASRMRMRNSVLSALAPGKPTFADRMYGAVALIGKPAPLLVRTLVIGLVVAGLLGSATVASADALPDDPLYSLKLAGEQLRLAIAVGAEDRASVELSIAEHRLDEAERLASNGREDDAIIATAGYGSSLADAAADLATIEAGDPRGAALVTQLQTVMTASQARIAATAARLADDPRTAGTAQILAAVGATSTPSKNSPATKIADQAAAITLRVATVADDRLKPTEPMRGAAPRASVTPRTDPPLAQTAARASAAVRPDTQAPPSNATTARQAAEKAKEAAQKALLAAEKANRAGTRTQSPVPTRR